MRNVNAKEPKSQEWSYVRFTNQIRTSGIIEFMFTGHWRVLFVIDSFKVKKTFDKERGTWQSFPSLQTIVKETKLNRATVQRAIRDLVEWGLIKKDKIPRKRGGGYYIVYTVLREPALKQPLKRIKEKTFRKKRKRGKDGKFTGWQ